MTVVSDSNQNMTLEEVLQFVEKKETGKRSANLLEFQGVEGLTSQYYKNQWLNNKEMVINKSDPCSRENMSMVIISPFESGNNIARRPTPPETFEANSSTLNVSVDSNRRTKRCKLANQTKRWHYLIVYVQPHHCNSMQMLQPHSPWTTIFIIIFVHSG